MRRLKSWLMVLMAGLTLAASVGAQAGNAVGLSDVLKDVAANYGTLGVLDLKLQQATAELDKIESQLGWKLKGGAALARDVSIFGSRTDRLSANAGLVKPYESGSSLSLTGVETLEDADAAFSPNLPNPAHNTNLDVSYRQPLWRGKGNPQFKQGRAAANAGVSVSESARDTVRDNVAERVSRLFFGAARTRARLENAHDAVQRARKLRASAGRDFSLGVSEKKDVLQAEAQLRARQADYDGLLAAWNQQRTDINRLTGKQWNAVFQPRVQSKPLGVPVAMMVANALAHSPDIKEKQARLASLDATIKARQDAQEDKLDLIYSAGLRRRAGDATGGNVDDIDPVASLSVEYERALDKRGVDAELTQALLDKDILRTEIEEARKDLEYRVHGLVDQINATRSALRSSRSSRDAERKKLQDARARYDDGREITSRLIQFETEYQIADLTYRQQLIDLAEKRADLQRLTGTIWAGVTFADAGESPSVKQ